MTMTRNGRYESLAQIANEAGYGRVTVSQVHMWANHGLLPAVRVAHTGFGRREISEPECSHSQLLALCRARFDLRIRNTEYLAAWLWSEGFPVDIALARRGLHRRIRQIPTALARYRGTQEQADALDDLALRGATEVAHAGPERDTGLLHRGLYEALAMHIGAGTEEEPDMEGLEAVERLIGLDRARTDRIGDADPWLDMPPGMAALDGLTATSIERLCTRLDLSSDTELEEARKQAVDLRTRWAVLSEMLRLSGGPNFAGLAVLGAGLNQPMGLPDIVVVLLSFPAQTAAFLAGLPSGDDLEGISEAIDQLGSILASDPELAARVEASGLMSALGGPNEARDEMPSPPSGSS